MEKISFADFNLDTKLEVSIINFNDIDIQVKQYLPMQEKVEIIQNVLALGVDPERPYYFDPCRTAVLRTIEVIDKYTNIEFSEEDRSDLAKLYDSVVSNGLWEAVQETIPRDELTIISLWESLIQKAIMEHENSIMGMMENVTQDYKDTQFDATQIQQALKDPENMALLKELLPLISNEAV